MPLIRPLLVTSTESRAWLLTRYLPVFVNQSDCVRVHGLVGLQWSFSFFGRVYKSPNHQFGLELTLFACILMSGISFCDPNRKATDVCLWLVERRRLVNLADDLAQPPEVLIVPLIR